MDDFKEIKFVEPKEPEMSKPTMVKLADITDMFKTVSTVPTYIPRNFSEQFVIYTSGATYRLYIYDTGSNQWRQATLT